MLSEPDHGVTQGQAGRLEVWPEPGRDSCTARSPSERGQSRAVGVRGASGDQGRLESWAGPASGRHPGAAGSPRGHLGFSGS